MDLFVDTKLRMGVLSSEEIRNLEMAYPLGIPSSMIVDVFVQSGHRFSEATLRKYVQLGLLPNAKRVGAKGRNRGSSGLYPVTVMRQINDIKAALDRGATLEEIRLSTVGLQGEVWDLQRTYERTVGRFKEALQRPERSGRPQLRQELEQRRRVIDRELQALGRLAEQLPLKAAMRA